MSPAECDALERRLERQEFGEVAGFAFSALSNYRSSWAGGRELLLERPGRNGKSRSFRAALEGWYLDFDPSTSQEDGMVFLGGKGALTWIEAPDEGEPGAVRLGSVHFVLDTPLQLGGGAVFGAGCRKGDGSAAKALYLRIR
jgi:hypothetical protein